MKRMWLLPLAALTLWARPAIAQNEPALPEEPQLDPPAMAERPRQPDLLLVDARNIGALRALVPGRGVRAVSLALNRAALAADEVAGNALSEWVRGGGTVFLHTDAAQLFGYTTARPRPGNARVAGQLWGRATAAIGFGAHPLLLGAVSDNDRQALTSAISGVRTVYYQLTQDDALAVSHAAAVPILRVTDLAVSNGPQLYAAAVAPWGQGWAIFTPALVEQNRADGALFVYNLMKWAGAVVPGADDGRAFQDAEEPGPPPYNLASRHIDEAAAAAQRGGFDAAATAMKFLLSIQPEMPAPAAGGEATQGDATQGEGAPRGEGAAAGAAAGAAPPAPPAETAAPAPPANAPATPAAPAAPATARPPADELGLPLSRAEFSSILRILGGVRADQPDTLDRARAVVFLLSARLAWQQGDGRAVTLWLNRANDIVGGTAEAYLIAGWQLASASEDRSLPSAQRARLLAEAIESWRQSLNDAPLVPGTPPAGGAGTVVRNPNAGDGNVLVAGVPRSLVRDWIRTSEHSARLLAAQPPLVDGVGAGDAAIAVRYFENDPSLRIAVPAAQQLANFADVLGARGDAEELMFFPTPEYYAAYHRVAAVRQNAPAPGGYVGDAIDGQMMMLSQPSQMILIPSGVPGQPARPAAFPSAAPNVMSRIHSQVLINQIAGGHMEGEDPVPAWLRMGMATYAARAMSAALGTSDLPNDPLAAPGGFGRLLSPADYQNLGNGADDNTVADVQAGRLVQYFYTRYGPGAVVETLQRLGAGEAVDDAMEAVTGLTEEQFFMAWYNAETGNRGR